MKKQTFHCIRSAAAALVLALSAGASFATTVTYDGRLLGADGSAQTNATVGAVLRAYASNDATEPISSQNVTIQTDAEGFFSISTTSLDIPTGCMTFWLGVTPDGGSEIAPRMRVSPAPFALRAAEARALEVDGEFKVNGKVQITNLDVAGELVSQELVVTDHLDLKGDVVGAETLFTGDIDLNGGFFSLFRPVSRNWETMVSVHLIGSSDKTATACFVAEDDGIVVARISMDTGDYTRCHAFLGIDNGDFLVSNSAVDLRLTSKHWRYFTFPVRRGKTVIFTLKTHRDTIIRTPETTVEVKRFYAGVY